MVKPFHFKYDRGSATIDVSKVKSFDIDHTMGAIIVWYDGEEAEARFQIAECLPEQVAAIEGAFLDCVYGAHGKKAAGI